MLKRLGIIFTGIMAVLIVIVIYWFIRGQLLVNRLYKIESHSYGTIRIVALADLHGRRFCRNQRCLIKKVQLAEPDVIVYVGDMIEKTNVDDSINSVITLTKGLMNIAPVYYVDGNHELDMQGSAIEKYILFNKNLEKLGATHLDNEIVSAEIKKTKINICGMTTHYYWEDEEQELSEKIRNMDGINIMLCHYPESILWYKPFGEGGLDVAICGHTHGGLIRIPFRGGMYAPEWSYWPKYDLGEYPIYTDTDWHNYGGGTDAKYLGTMIISGGLSGEHHVPRINNPCEISIIDIKGYNYENRHLF